MDECGGERDGDRGVAESLLKLLPRGDLPRLQRSPARLQKGEWWGVRLRQSRDRGIEVSEIGQRRRRSHQGFRRLWRVGTSLAGLTAAGQRSGGAQRGQQSSSRQELWGD